MIKKTMANIMTTWMNRTKDFKSGGPVDATKMKPAPVIGGTAAEALSPRGAPFQTRVNWWMQPCFDTEEIYNVENRSHRFLEEALEMAQACGASADEAHQLVDYVFGRPIGEPKQEAGGTMLTLAALCTAMQINLDECAEAELTRVWAKIDQIRAKQASKPKDSPLPGKTPSDYRDGWEGE